MKKWIIFVFAMLPSIALADASIGTEGTRTNESGMSKSIKRDKSLSADKSRGNRATESDSRERAQESSRSRQHQERAGKTWEKSDSYSADININGLLLREFTARYERANNGHGAAGDYFSTCRPLLNATVDYPTVNYDQGGITGRAEALRGSGRGYVTTRGDISRSIVPDPQNRYIARYAQCRMTASYWVTEAGDRVTRQSVTTESEVRDRISAALEQMDSEEELFQELRQRARDVWQSASCSNWLGDYTTFNSPELDCGVFTFIGQSFTVENRETLTESSINGRSYKIAINASESQNVAVEDSASNEGRVSYSEREGDSRERFSESKKTASTSKSKSMDRNNSTKVDRSSSSSMKAAPKD